MNAVIESVRKAAWQCRHRSRRLVSITYLVFVRVGQQHALRHEVGDERVAAERRDVGAHHGQNLGHQVLHEAVQTAHLRTTRPHVSVSSHPAVRRTGDSGKGNQTSARHSLQCSDT